MIFFVARPMNMWDKMEEKKFTTRHKFSKAKNIMHQKDPLGPCSPVLQTRPIM